jgi:hypothetical protein
VAIAGRVVPHEAQNLCPAAVIAVPQLGQKPIPVAISISVQHAEGIVMNVRPSSRLMSASCRNPIHPDQSILAAGCWLHG